MVRGMNWLQMLILAGGSAPLGPVGPPVRDPVTYLIEEGAGPPRTVSFGTPQNIMTIAGVGIWANGDRLFVSANDGLIHMFNKSTLAADGTISLHSSNSRPWGVTGRGDDLYVAQWNSSVVFHYKISTGVDVGTIQLGANRTNNGLASDGTDFFGAESSGNRVRRYNSQWVAQDVVTLGILPAGQLAALSVDEHFYYAGTSANIFVYRRDNVARPILSVPIPANGLHVDGNVAYTGFHRGGIGRTQMTFMGGRPRRLATEDGMQLLAE